MILKKTRQLQFLLLLNTITKDRHSKRYIFKNVKLRAPLHLVWRVTGIVTFTITFIFPFTITDENVTVTVSVMRYKKFNGARSAWWFSVVYCFILTVMGSMWRSYFPLQFYVTVDAMAYWRWWRLNSIFDFTTIIYSENNVTDMEKWS